MMHYPLKAKSKWADDPQYSGGKLTWMTPAAYLSRVPKLGSKKDAALIKKHVKRIKKGKKLKPLAIYSSGNPNGRHRATAAKELGISKVPVLVGGHEPAKYDGKLAVKGKKP